MNKITMNDIAKLAGVSKATVSMVLNKKDHNISKETRDKVLKISKEVKYIPNCIARSLSTKKSGTIGMIIPDIINPYFSEIARSIEDAANYYGYNIILCNSDNNVKKEENYINLLISKLVDGVIFVLGSQKSESISILKNNNIPFILVDRYINEYERLNGIYCNNEKGAEIGTEYLYSLGNRNIVFVTGPKEVQVSRNRLMGYESIMKKYDIYNKSYIYEGDFTFSGGEEVTEKIVRNLKNIDAIFYSNDAMAIGGLKVLKKSGYKVPNNISVMGFDNIQVSKYIEPALTTISQPIYNMGKEACKMLIDLINERAIKDGVIYFTPDIIKRETT